MTERWVSRGSTSGKGVKQGYAVVRAYNAAVLDMETRKVDVCWHNHRSPGAARKCAEAAAKRWNKAGTSK